jgi:hypothetical protein
MEFACRRGIGNGVVAYFEKDLFDSLLPMMVYVDRIVE